MPSEKELEEIQELLATFANEALEDFWVQLFLSISIHCNSYKLSKCSYSTRVYFQFVIFVIP